MQRAFAKRAYRYPLAHYSKSLKTSRANLRRRLGQAFDFLGHGIGQISRKYYFEDYIRVYPDGKVFNRVGLQRKPTQFDLNNFLNHKKFYAFAAQFVNGSKVADAGCGSGYGCELLKNSGAHAVFGTDLSKSAVEFAISRFGQLASFSVQPITCMNEFATASMDVTVCSEVLEHVKEYGKQDDAIVEMKRITRHGGLVVIGTPNSELLGNHGFSFDEIDALMSRHFTAYRIFENALVPQGAAREHWNARVATGRVGIIVGERINPMETAQSSPGMLEVKSGLVPGVYQFANIAVNTALLHNTHSWVVLAIV